METLKRTSVLLALLAGLVFLTAAQISSSIVKNDSATESGTTTYTDGGGDDGEATIFTFSPTTRVVVHGIWFDLNEMTQDGTINCYFEVDGTNSRLWVAHAFTVATDPDGTLLSYNVAIDDELICKYDEGADEGADRDIPYRLIYSKIQ